MFLLILQWLTFFLFCICVCHRSAIVLDVVAFSALVIYITRVVLGYKQTWDRYQVSQFYWCSRLILTQFSVSIWWLIDAFLIKRFKQLLVNRTLYEKTIASGFGSVHFLLDASEQQQVSFIYNCFTIFWGAYMKSNFNIQKWKK